MDDRRVSIVHDVRMGKQRTRATGPFRSLVVPIDLTPSSDRVVGRLVLLPLAEDARITLLHVVPGGLSHEQRIAERDARKAIAEEARHLRALMDGRLVPKRFAIEPLVRCGAAATEIASCAFESNAELIVMGRGGTSPFRDAFLGSTAERVIRQARLPVLVVRLPARREYSRPALALDLDSAAQQVVGFLLRILPAPRAPVEVIHAFNAPYHGLVYPSLPDEVARHAKDELRTAATHELANLLATAVEKAGVERKDVPRGKLMRAMAGLGTSSNRS